MWPSEPTPMRHLMHHLMRHTTHHTTHRPPETPDENASLKRHPESFLCFFGTHRNTQLPL
jgi:hypothetical protein